MDNFDRDLDDLLNMTDSDDDSDSSNGVVFDNRDPVVLELHELKKDEPTSETAEPQETKKKREKRKKRKHPQDPNREATSDTSSSLSDSVPTVADETNREEFYDAHESYHALSENQQASPTAALVLAQVHSHHVEDPKIIPERTTTTTSERTSATPREPSTINKPVSNPPPQ